MGVLSTPSSIGTINVSSTYRLMMERCAVDATCRISAEAPRIDVFNTNSVDISRTQVHPLLGDLSALKRISTAKVHSDLHADDEARRIADSYATTSVKRPRRSDMFHIKSVEIYRTQGHPYLGDLSAPKPISSAKLNSDLQTDRRLMMGRRAWIRNPCMSIHQVSRDI